MIELPVLQIGADVDRATFDDVLAEFGSYDWIVFTSANGVRHFFDALFEVNDDIRMLGMIRIAAVGEGTANHLRALHLRIDLQPKTATADALAQALVDTGGIENSKILVITGNLNADTLWKKL
ncbi:MAG TPA: uroporphyrinogen-III synthase, partial [Acetobacteraceae bacterium]|nr:uroporphyrinogen-III synthase [Acetobacteraceae bacterium]